MDAYLDIHLRQDPELAAHQILTALYTRLHRTLARIASNNIGLSFPAHDERIPTLGEHMRLHGSADALNTVMSKAWLAGLQEHVRLSSVTAIPSACSHREVRRVQAKSSVDRLRRRAIRRHGLAPEEADRRIPYSAAERLQLPFVILGSHSTGQPTFPLFIRHGPLQTEPVAGLFNSYGLGHGATVPWF